MIISKTPFRISFFGGGTDYPDWYLQEGGSVLSTTINKYCYITLRELPKFFEYKYRLRYFQTEEINSVNDIKHPSVRECVKFLGISRNFELVHFADMPARSGLGSSSTFTVGLLHALHAFENNMVTKNQLTMEAIHVEQNLIKENVGSQDQAAAAYGSFNHIHFYQDGSINPVPIVVHSQRMQELQDNLLMVFTGFSRTASEIAEEQIKNIPSRRDQLLKMNELTTSAINILQSPEHSIDDFGELMNEQWQVKKELSSKITSKGINAVYDAAISAGAIGGKLLGAGSGGFMLLYVNSFNRERVKQALNDKVIIDFKFENLGTSLIHYTPE